MMPDADRVASDFYLERYRYIIQQLHTVNENVYRFLAIYQAVATTLVGAMLALFVTYREWNLSASAAQAGVVGLGVLVTIVALFVMVLVVIGMLTWLDYRREECNLTDSVVGVDFRERPDIRNWYRWYEVYILLLILATVLFMWLAICIYMLPSMDN